MISVVVIRCPFILQACYGVLTNTEVREALDSRQFHGASAAMIVVHWKELKRNSQVWLPLVKDWVV